METTDEETPGQDRWQLVLAVGTADEWTGGLGATNVAVSPDPGVLDDVSLEAADLRARTLVAVGDASIGALSAWAYLSGLAGRILDVACRSGDDISHLDCQARVASGREAPGPKPQDRVKDVELDAGAVTDSGLVDENDVGATRWAKRVTVGWRDGIEMFRDAAWIAGVRDRRGDGGRLPKVNVYGHIVDLEGIRLQGAAKRRLTNNAAEVQPVEPVAMTRRQTLLSEAAQLSAVDVLTNFGSETDGSLWNCPRPHRHTHGDSVPSMRVTDSAVRCFRCDSEWTDVLRLAMDVTGLGPDDTADLLLGTPERFKPYRDAIVATRASKATPTAA